MAKKPKHDRIDWEALGDACATSDEAVKKFLADGRFASAAEITTGTGRREDAVRGALKRLMGRQVIEREYRPAPVSGQRTAIYRLLPVGR